VYDAASVPSMVREYLSGVSIVPTPPSTGAAQPVEPK